MTSAGQCVKQYNNFGELLMLKLDVLPYIPILLLKNNNMKALQRSTKMHAQECS